MENEYKDPDYKPFTDKGLVRFLCIAFVFVVYLYIFLKVLVLS
jgi:hypothetical protein